MRWTNLDKKLKLTQPLLIKEFDEINNLVSDYVKLLDLNETNIYSLANARTKGRIDKVIKELKDLGVYSGYNALYIKSLNNSKMRNVDALEIMILGAYMSSNIEKISNDVFLFVAEDVKQQAAKEMPFQIGKLAWGDISALTVVPSTHLVYSHYLELLKNNHVNQLLKTILASTQARLPIDLTKVLEKQRKQILSVHDDVHSGVLHDTCISLWNKIYCQPLLKRNEKVKFVAIVDNKTTDMCLSLHGQIFNTVDENTFTRFFESQGGEVEVTVKGLVDGVNYPPITDYQHHCRSTIVYQK